MGNCYGEDGDSEDEYYGYYGKNNRLKPQPDPAPPQPDPPAHIPCHYEDDVRGYDDGQDSHGNEPDTYSDHAEPDSYELDHNNVDSPTPFERKLPQPATSSLNYHPPRHTTHLPRMGYYDEDSDDEYYGFYGRNNHRKPQPDPTPPEPYHQQESKSEVDKGYELEGLEYEDDEDERFEPEYEGDEEELEELRPEDEEDEMLETNGEVIRYEHRELESGNDGTPELRELEYETQEPHQLGCEYGIDEVQELGEPNLWTQQPPQLEYELERELESENDEVHEHDGLETGNDEVQELGEPNLWAQHHPQPEYELEHENDEVYELDELEYEPERSDTDTQYGIHEPQTLESNGVPQHAEPSPQYHTPATPPAHTPHLRNTPRSNQRGRATTVKDVQHRTPPFPLPYTPYIPHPGPTHAHPLSSPSPTAFVNTRGLTPTNNDTIGHHHLTPPYPIARSRPPPRPSDYRNGDQNQNQNQHTGEYTPTTITTSARPPPWPIIAAPSPISSTSRSRPPPWPIIFAYTTRTSSGHQKYQHFGHFLLYNFTVLSPFTYTHSEPYFTFASSPLYYHITIPIPITSTTLCFSLLSSLVV
jgi:hypothetical protein